MNDAPPTVQSEMMTVADVAKRLNVSESFVYARIAEGMPHYRLGNGRGGIRVSEEQLQAYLRSREKGGASVPRTPFSHDRYPSSS
jgi:excisionase family DNA binding protein